MLTPTDFVDDTERQQIYNFAPAKGIFPGIFPGKKPPDNNQKLNNVYYSEIYKSKLRRSDRRAAMYIENIFFKGKSQIALRKCKLGNRTLTAGHLKTPEGIESLICHDEGNYISYQSKKFPHQETQSQTL